MNDPFIKYPTANRVGFIPAYAGDGVVTERIHVARGTVQPQTSPTICTQRGGGCGVVIDNVGAMHTPGRDEQRQNDPRCKSDGTSFTITAQDRDGIIGQQGNELRIRYLTPRECLRLMGFDDPSIDKLMTAVPSKTNQYKLAGNSIVVDCLEQIFKAIYIDKTFRKPRPRQISLFDIPEKKRVNPILMRDAETIEREVSDLNTKSGRIKDNSVEISGDSIVEKGGDYVVGVTDCDE